MTGIAALAFAVAVAAALAQAVTGFGSALVIVPLLTLVIGPQAAVVSATGMSAIISIYVTVRIHHQVAWKRMLTVSLAAILGMPLGLLALTRFSEKALTILIGVVLLVLVAAILCGLHLPQRWPIEAGVGFVSGGLLTSTGANGPPIAAVFQAMRLPPVTFRATMLASLCVQDTVAIFGFGAVGGISLEVLIVLAAGLPGLLLGWWGGNRLFARFHPNQFRWVVLAMLIISALAAVAQAILS